MPKLRLSLCRNSGKARGKIQSGILVEPSFDAIATAAKNKLRLSAKELKTIRLFNQKTGVEFIRGGELELKTDSVVGVSTGEDYLIHIYKDVSDLIVEDLLVNWRAPQLLV